MQQELDLVVVANRLPVYRVDCGDDATWETSPGGLVPGEFAEIELTGTSPGGLGMASTSPVSMSTEVIIASRAE